MNADLSKLMFRAYRGVRTDISAEVEAIFPVATQPTQNADANAALDQLVIDVHDKRSDDGLRTARAVLDPL